MGGKTSPIFVVKKKPTLPPPHPRWWLFLGGHETGGPKEAVQVSNIENATKFSTPEGLEERHAWDDVEEWAVGASEVIVEEYVPI